MRDTADPVLAYAPSPGMPELVSAVQAYYRGLGVSYEPGHILITAGGSEALTFLMLCILDEGDEVLIPEPFYPNYNTFVRAAGGVIRPIPTTPAEGYRFSDRTRLEALITDRTRAILLSDPGNPTGAVLTAEERRILADVALAHGLYLVADHFQQWLLTDFSGQGETVMFAPGGPFYATPGRGRNEIRIAYVLKPAALERAMELLALGLKAYQELEPFDPTA